MHKLKQIQTRFDCAAESYDSHANLQQQVLQHTFESAKNYIKAGSVLLDAGCGTGQLLSITRDMDISIFSLDLAHRMCKQTSSNQAITSDFHQLPIKDNGVDIYFSSLAWQWSDDLKILCAEAFRVVKPSGYIIVSTLVDGTLKELQSSFAQLDGQRRSLSFESCDIYENAIKDAGFTLLSSSQTTITRSHNSARDLLHSIKGIGASHSPSSQPLSKAMLAELEVIYPKQSGKTIATWEVATFIAQKVGS